MTAGDIPEQLTVDLSKLEDIGDTITISDVEIPAGAKLTITDRDFVICNAAAPSALKSDSDDEDETDADEVPTVGDEEGDASRG